MARGTAIIDIEKAQYTLLGVDGIPRARRPSVNGLFQLVEEDVMILTGTADGRVRLTVETSSEAPPLELEGWDDVVEVSQRSDPERSATGEIAVAPLFDGPVEGLPQLTLPSGSSIRIRIHARGRDEGAKYWGVDEPVEEHLLQIWPAPESEDVCHRLSDKYGEMKRVERSDESGRIRLASGIARIDIRNGLYTLAGIDAGPHGIRSGGSGLFVSDADGARIQAGTAQGRLHLTLEEYAEPPPIGLEGWDDVVEVSQRSDTGEVAIASALLEDPVALPRVRVPPGSSIRLRVHARGRDEAAKYTRIEEPIEEHLLQMWPAPEAEEVWHRISDQLGEVMRSQWSAGQ